MRNEREHRSCACMVLAVAASAALEVVVDTEFGGPGRTFEDVRLGKGIRVTVSLPEGWSDNGGWKDSVAASYTPVAEDGRGGPVLLPLGRRLHGLQGVRLIRFSEEDLIIETRDRHREAG